MKNISVAKLVVFLLIGLANALAIFFGLRAIGTAITLQRFSSIQAFQPEPEREIINLPNNKFAIIEKYSIEVYDIDATGKLSRVDSVKLGYKDLKRD